MRMAWIWLVRWRTHTVSESGLLKSVIYGNGVLLQFSRTVWIWLPDQALIEGSAADVRQLLAENAKDAETMS
jgi:hypothetical protein